MEPGMQAVVEENLAWITTLQQWVVQNGAEYMVRLLGALVIFFIGRWAANMAVRATGHVMERSNVDQTLRNFVNSVLYYALLAIVSIIALNNLGVETTSVIAIFGAATLAIGLALQDSLNNFASGVSIILFRPYAVGDYIQAAGETGFVKDLRIFHTELRTRDNKQIIIPNGQVINGNITNYSANQYMRVDMTFGIGYDDDIKQAKEIFQEILNECPDITDQPVPTVNVSELADSSVNFAVRGYAKVDNEVRVRFFVTEQVKLRLDEAGISIPYPQRDVHLFQQKN